MRTGKTLRIIPVVRRYGKRSSAPERRVVDTVDNAANLGKEAEMFRRCLVLVLAVAGFSMATSAAPAQSQAQRGYWDHGQWIGYEPPHLKYARQSGQYTQRAQQTTKAVASDADETASPQRRPAAARGVATQTQYQSPITQRQPQRRVTPASAEMIEPTPMDGPVAEDGDMIAPDGNPGCGCGGGDCGGGCDSCGGYGDCGCGCEGPCEYGFAAVCWPRQVWIRGEYLGWWTTGMHLPPLVTDSLTDPFNTSHILFGNETVNRDARSGGRFRLGMWLDPCQTRGVEASYLGLGSEETSYLTPSTATTLGRPYFNMAANPAAAAASPIVDTGRTGSVGIDVQTKFQGVEVLYRRATKRCPMSNVDLLLGWRWLELQDDLGIASTTTYQAATANVFDEFHTKNGFNGVELGFEWTRPLGCLWTLEMLGKVSLGNTSSTVRISGASKADADQGLLARDSNIGIHTRDSLASVTELGLTLRRRFTPRLEATFGYSFIYWSDVLRAGDQVDLDLNLGTTGVARPIVPMNSTDFWAQGLHCGLEYTF
jgi:hypothetical protein